MSLDTISDQSSLVEALDSDKLVLVYIWADFHEACVEGGQMDQILTALLSEYPDKLRVLKCNAELDSIADWAEKSGVESVPTILLFNKKVLEKKIEGVVPTDILKSVEELIETNPSDITKIIKNELDKEPLKRRLKALIDSSKVFVFMKGTPDEPKCKFSRALMEILKPINLNFSSFNILDDNQVREGLKEYSGWKTYPQIYVNGALLGGLDSVKELVEKGTLEATLLKDLEFKPAIHHVHEEPKEDLNDRLKKLVNSSNVMLFMKGDPSEPRCGFSQRIVSILDDEEISYSTFDILEDNSVREGLKKFSNWPTYPQLYVNGDLIGGLDIVQEMASDGDLKEQLGL